MISIDPNNRINQTDHSIKINTDCFIFDFFERYFFYFNFDDLVGILR